MARIHNSEVSKNLIDGAKIQTNVDDVPAELAKSVVPTLEVNPDMLRKVEVVEDSVSPGGTVYTTPTNKSFYLTGVSYSANATAAGQNVTTIRAVKNGQTISLASIRLLGTVAVDSIGDSGFLDFSRSPILLDRGTNVSTSVISGTLASFFISVTGYIVED